MVPLYAWPWVPLCLEVVIENDVLDCVQRVWLEHDVMPVTELQCRPISLSDLTLHARVTEMREIEQTSTARRKIWTDYQTAY